jgi:adenine-specific DNA-methyltransferase
MLAGLCGGRAHVATLATDYRRYVGAQIGIHNPQGARVGTVSHLRNTEYLFIAAERPLAGAIGDLAAAARTASPTDA